MPRTAALVFALLMISLSAPADKGKWIRLFDGKTLGGWKQTDFAAGGDARVEPKFKGKGPAIVVEMGDTLSGVHWASDTADFLEIPRANYEIALEVLKVDGNDFPLGLTFPVGGSHGTFVLGGWGGMTTGISSIDEKDASENETTRSIRIQKDRWYKVRLRVAGEKIQAWLDDKKIVDQSIKGRKIGLRSGEINRSLPLGLATFRTTAAFREMKIRRLEEK